MACHNKDNGREEKIRFAIDNQLATYPESTLQDLYKNFFQDYFGPEHIISDTLSAGAYLNKELAEMQEESLGGYYESTGYKGNFYRVNLSVIQDSLISRDMFFDAFVRSAANIEFPSVDQWKQEWKQIDSIIYTMDLNLADYNRDRENIFSLIEQGKYAMHHSKVFSENYAPHYRIIRKDIFENELFLEFLPHMPLEQ